MTLEQLEAEFQAAFAITLDPSQSLQRRSSAMRRVTNTSMRIAGLKNSGRISESYYDERGTIQPYSAR